jgi:hypothetical protein
MTALLDVISGYTQDIQNKEPRLLVVLFLVIQWS